MIFIMNEKKFCEDIINGITDEEKIKSISLNYIVLLMNKYYKLYGGVDKEYVKIISSLKNVSYYKTFDMFDKYTKKNKDEKTILREINNIIISKDELEYINKLPNKETSKLFCTLLALSKFYNSSWINVSYSELFKLSNIVCNIDKRCEIIKTLVNLGYVSMNHYDNDISIKINDIENIKTTGKYKKDMIIDDISNIGKKYIVATENKIMCEICGRLVEKRISRKYCKPCSKRQKSIKTYNAFLKKKKEQENKENRQY